MAVVFFIRVWRNWYTRGPEGLIGQPMSVQLRLLGPFGVLAHRARASTLQVEGTWFDSTVLHHSTSFSSQLGSVG